MDLFLMNTHFSLAWVSLSDYSKKKFNLMYHMLKIICNSGSGSRGSGVGREGVGWVGKQCLIHTLRPWLSWKSLEHL